MNKYLLTGLFILLPSLGAFAQQTDDEELNQTPREMLYVTDQLRLSLYPEPNDRTKALEFLSSGDRLGVLEIEGPYAYVIAPSGNQGWVKRGFLLPRPTAKLLLDEEKKNTLALTQEIEKLSNSKIVIDQYERDMDELSKNLAISEEARTLAEQKITDLETEAREKAELEAAVKAARENQSAPPIQALFETMLEFWHYLLPIALLVMLLGALIAKLVIDTRIKKRFHGMKLW